MKFLFIHAHVTLEYFNFKKETKFKRFTVYFLPSDCWKKRKRSTSESSQSFSLTACSISECIPTSNKICTLIPHPKHCDDLVWHMLTLYKRAITHRRARIGVTLQSVKLFHHSILLFIIILYTTELSASWAWLNQLLVSSFPGR